MKTKQVELDGEIESKLSQFDEALDSIESKVVPFLKKPVSEMVPRLTPTENAKLNMSYSYTLNALYYMLLKCQGVQPSEHPVKKDLDRIKRYMAKTLTVDKSLKAKSKAKAQNPPPTSDSSKPKPKSKSKSKAMSKSTEAKVASIGSDPTAASGDGESPASGKSPQKKRKQVAAHGNKKKAKKKKRRKK